MRPDATSKCGLKRLVYAALSYQCDTEDMKMVLTEEPASRNLLHTSTYLTIRQHTSAYLSIRQHTSAYLSIPQHTSAYLSIPQHTSAYVSIPQHTSAYVSIRQHTSAYVSIRQHTSAYVSIRQHTSAVLNRGACVEALAAPPQLSVFVLLCRTKQVECVLEGPRASARRLCPPHTLVA
jgi:hypothetical protein